MPDVPQQIKLNTLNAQIAERTQYLKDQESTINTIIEAGNHRLQDLNIDIALATKELKELNENIRSKRQYKKDLEEDAENLKREIKQSLNESGLSGLYA